MRLGAAWAIFLESKMSAKCQQNTKPLSTDAELTCQLVARHVEDSQIGKVAKLLGKAAYRKMAIISTKPPAQIEC